MTAASFPGEAAQKSLWTPAESAAYSCAETGRSMMAQDSKAPNYFRLALGAGVLAAAAVGVAAFVPRRHFAFVIAPLGDLVKSPVAVAVAAWATGFWHDATAPRAPAFNDLRPFDEF
jgi:hypothetical protein